MLLPIPGAGGSKQHGEGISHGKVVTRGEGIMWEIYWARQSCSGEGKAGSFHRSSQCFSSVCHARRQGVTRTWHGDTVHFCTVCWTCQVRIRTMQNVNVSFHVHAKTLGDRDLPSIFWWALWGFLWTGLISVPPLLKLSHGQLYRKEWHSLQGAS